jgi:hypothetical protein
MEIGPGRRRLTPGRRAGEGSGEREDGGGRRLRRAGGWRRAKAPESERAAAGLGWGGFGNSGSASVAPAHGGTGLQILVPLMFLHRIESTCRDCYTW